jgi:ubiquinone/menaquinone biosynthesis C-methylase UbiE
MTDIQTYIQRLLEASPLRDPVLRSIIQALHLPFGSKGLDAGCGIGLQSILLADGVGPEGHITGLDIVPEFLVVGEYLAKKAGFSQQITFREGDVNCLPFGENSFDWVWSADCIGYPARELNGILMELMRVVRPGGSVIVLAWSSQQLLPGYPLLEARLNATCSSYIPCWKGEKPELHFLRALKSFQEAGLEEIKAQTFVGDVQAPIKEGERIALKSLFEMLWGEPTGDVSPEDWSDYQRLCRAESSDFIVNQPGYYAFFTYTLFRGTVPAG